MIDLSAVIVAYNDYADVIAAIDSLEQFTSKEISKKVYIVDNSSNIDIFEQDRAELKAKILSFEDVEYIDAGENLGFGKGNNLILRLFRKSWCFMSEKPLSKGNAGGFNP